MQYSEIKDKAKEIYQRESKDYNEYRKKKGPQKNAYYDHLISVTDDKGENVTQRTIKVKKPVPEEYIMLYYKRMLVEYIEPVGYDAFSKLLIAIAGDIHYAQYDESTDTVREQLLFVNKTIRQGYAERLGVSERRITQMIGQLCDAKILRRVQRGMYAVNPFVIGKGDWSDILKVRDVWTVEEDKLVHQVTVKQQKPDGSSIKTKQITQKEGSTPKVNQVIDEEPPVEGQISIADLLAEEESDTLHS